MDLKSYFTDKTGFGVLSTADAEGRVDAAVYASPHVAEDKTLVFVMGGRLTHANLAANPFAVYLFREDGGGYAGKRLFLRKVRESSDAAEVAAICRAGWPGAHGAGYCAKGEYAVYFTVEKILPLVGAGEENGK